MVSCLKKAGVWSCTPMRSLTLRGSRRTSMPRTSILPASAGRRPSIISTVVLLPAPLGPSIPNILPGSTWNETPSTARSGP